MKRTTTSQLVTASLLLAIGILVPMIFHIFGVAGQAFLPMHIPIIIGGYILAPQLAFILGLLTPFLSSFLTAMPVLFPIAVIMMVELSFYALTISVLTKVFKQNTMVSLVIAMVVGRIMAGLTVYCLVLLFNIKMKPILYVKAALITGMPGIIIQLILIPVLLHALKKSKILK